MRETIKNPLFPAGDPFLLCHGGMYYMYFTNELTGAADGFRVYASSDLAHWEDRGHCLKKGDVIGEQGFWAPEVIFHKGKFYMVYVADEHLAVAVADSPLGPFRQSEKKWLSQRNAIDGHFFLDDDGQMYLYYVRFCNGNMIYAAKMSDDLRSIDEENEKFLIAAEAGWETLDCLVAEGPFVLKHKGLYYLTYSANHTRCPDYAVGYAVSAVPLGPFEKYSGNPILRRSETVFGVGHHSFSMSKDGKRLLCAYHCHNSPQKMQPRMACIDEAEFVSDPEGGADILVIHGPSGTR